MSAQFYNRMQKTAIRLIDKYGRPIEIIRRGANSGPAYNPIYGPDEKILVKYVETSETYIEHDVTITARDKIGIISPLTAKAPMVQDRIDVDGTVFEMVSVMPLNPGGTVMFYEFIAKR